MMNINGYLRWRGDLRISATRPFNAVDAMVLARFSYLPFDRIRIGKTDAIEDVARKMSKLKREDFSWPDDYDLIHLLGESRRFGLMRVSDYVKHNDEAAEKQFSAITVHTSPNEMYLSFFGTDASLYGWKEDFNMTFMDYVPAQAEAAAYLKKLAWKYPWKRIRLGGHSKGGNLAMYAAVTAPDARQRRIARVYNFDGPGLNKKLASADDGLISILPRIQSYIPQDSIIGRLLEHREKFEVVESVEKDMYQHNIYSWQVGPEAPVKAEATKKSDFIDKTITKWVESATPEQRRIFIDCTFEIIGKSNLKNPMVAFEKWRTNIPGILKSYRELSREDRKVFTEVLKKLIGSYTEVRAEQQGKARE